MKIVGSYKSKSTALSTAKALRAKGPKRYTWFVRKGRTTGNFNIIRARKGDL